MPASLDSPTAEGLSNPFPGLRPFEPEEDYLFFGREQQTAELVSRLRTNRFLAILGTSGCGKSSLVRSGLIPSLHGGGMTGAGSSWRVAILRPGEDPLGNLAAALTAPEALGEGSDDEGLTRAFFSTTLRASKRGLVECIAQARLKERDNVLVLVDQFEEIFRFKRGRRLAGRDEAVAFVKLLLEAARHREARCYIALTMRSDFIGNCMEFGDLPETINTGLYLVPRMTRDELRSTITGPVAVGGAAIAPRLVSRLLNDVGDDPDQLPILQHALLRTWSFWQEDHAPGEPLDLRHYEAIGTMKEALSRHAEEAFGELDAAGQAVAEKVFKALTDKGTDDRGVRHPAPLAEVAEVAGASEAAVAAVVATFRKPGRSFLMPPAGVPLHAGSILDISHESLMRIWGRLDAWVGEEVRSARLYLDVARAAARHAAGTAALWREPELALALAWRDKERPSAAWAARYEPAFDRALAFLAASQAERDQQIAERDALRRGKLRRARLLALVSVAASLIVLAFGAFAWTQKQRAQEALAEAQEQRGIANDQRTHADQQRREALHQQTLAERQTALAQAEKKNAEHQSQVALEQRGLADSERRKAEASALEADSARSDAVGQRERAEEQRRRAEEQRQSAEELGAQARAAEQQASKLRRISLARALALQLVRPQQGGERELTALLALAAYRLNRDNGGVPDDPDLFNALRVAAGSQPALRGPLDGVRALALAPDGRTLFAGGEDGRILRFDLRQPAGAAAPFGQLPSPVRALAVRAAGDLLAAGGAGGPIRLWDLRHPGAPSRDLAANGGVVSSVAFQPGGSLLAAAGEDGVRLWAVDSPGAGPNPSGGTVQLGQRATAVAWSEDGKTLAAGLPRHGAVLWDLGRPAARPREACGSLDVRSLAFRPGGRTLACGAGRGEIALADLGGGAPVTLLGHASSVNSLRFNPAGTTLASASSDGTVRLWDVRREGSPPIVLPGHEGWVWSVAFRPDGDHLVSASQDRTVRLWPARSEILARELCRTVARGLTRTEWERFMPADLPFAGEPPCPI